MPKKPTKRRKVPQWPLQVFDPFLEHHEEMSRILHLSMRGITMLQATPKTIEALIHWDEAGGLVSNRTKELENARRLADLAQTEVDTDFPLLHGQAAVSLWSALEDLMTTLMVNWLENEPSAKDADVLQKLRISFGEYESMDTRDRYLYVVELLSRQLVSGQQGVSRFESLLEPFGLSGKVDADVRKKLYELHQIRNALVHRRGIADKRLVSACPWLKLSVGEPVRVSHATYAAYSSAVGDYVFELIQRLRVLHGFGRYEAPREGPSEPQAVNSANS